MTTTTTAPAPTSTASTASTSMTARLRLLLTVVAGLAAVLVAMTYGFVFPESNQNTYLVHALAMHDPTLFAHDWYVREAADYHHPFSLLAAAMFNLKDGPELFVALDVALIVVTSLAILSLARSLFGEAVGVTAFFAWLAFGMLTRTSDVMDTFIFGGYLQPSSIGSAGYFWALALHARGRFGVAGVALAVAGLFHLNFLVLGIATLGLTHVATHNGRVFTRDFWTSVLRLMAAPTLVFLWALPQLLGAREGPTAEGLDILFNTRAPHHFRPTLERLWPFFAWQAAAWIVIVGHRKSALAVPAPLVRALAGVGGFVIAASLLTTIVTVTMVQQTFPWRMAPGASLLAFLVIVATALRSALSSSDPSSSESSPESTLSKALRAVSLIVAVPLAIYGTNAAWSTPERGRLFVEVLSAGLAAAILLRFVPSPAMPRLLRVAVPVFTGLVVVASFQVGLKTSARVLQPKIETVPEAKLQVTQWARTKTPKDAVFAVPPDFESFRFVARRAVVVDWKSSGMLPKDLVAWSKRMATATGTPLRSKRAAAQGHARMDVARAQMLHDTYGVDYVVFDKRATKTVPTIGPVVHKSSRYIVQRVPPRASSAPAVESSSSTP